MARKPDLAPTMPDGTQRAVVYCRVSTGLQERDGVSLDQQLDMARRFCELRGFTLVDTYIDTMTGTSDARPGLAKLESDLKRRVYDHVLVYKIDRLSRDQAHYHRLLQDFDRFDVGLASLTQPIDATSPIGKVILTILIALAQYESEQIGDRIRDSIAYRARQGYIIAGKDAPLGFTYHKAFTDDANQRHPGRFEVHEDEARVVRWIFEAYLRHRSVVKVLEAARQQGITGRDGRPLQRDQVRRILVNPLYTGATVACKRRVVRRGGTKITVPVPASEWVVREDMVTALVDKETWQAANDLFQENGVLPAARIGGRERSAWSGLLVCESCGRSLVYQAARKRGADGPVNRSASYLCVTRVAHGKEACHTPARVGVSFLDYVVAPALFGATERAVETKHAGRKPKARPAPDASAATRELSKLAKRREKLRDLYELTDMTMVEYRAKVAEVDRRIADLQLQMSTALPEERAPLPANLAETWARFVDEPGQRHRIMAALVHRIVVDGKRAVRVELRSYEADDWPATLSLDMINMNSRAGLKARGVIHPWTKRAE